MPKVSIVVPAYDGQQLLDDCLAALLQHTTGAFEILVVDDSHTGLAVNNPAVQLIRNPSNVGFLLSATRGVDNARGDYAVLLNTDALVTDGWLQSLLAVASEPGVGVVGAKLLNPDGNIQEAGGVVWGDASVSKFGVDMPPHSRPYNFVRDVNYVSGACMMLHRDFWERSNGFDPRFAPAYYEDADICMTARACDLRVLYQPNSVVHHAERASYQSTAKPLMRSNGIRFAQKWQTQLAADAANRVDPLQRPFGRAAGRIVIVDQYGSIDPSDLLQFIDGRSPLVVLASRWSHHQQADLEHVLQQRGVETIELDDEGEREDLYRRCSHSRGVFFAGSRQQAVPDQHGAWFEGLPRRALAEMLASPAQITATTAGVSRDLRELMRDIRDSIDDAHLK